MITKWIWHTRKIAMTTVTFQHFGGPHDVWLPNWMKWYSIRQLITIYYILQALHVLFARSMCLRTCRRAQKGGGRHMKGREGSQTMGLRHHPKKAIFGCSYLWSHQPVPPAVTQEHWEHAALPWKEGRRACMDILHTHKSDCISQHNCLIRGVNLVNSSA